MSQPSTSTSKVAAAAAMSGHLDTRTAATEVAGTLHDQLGGTADLVIYFASFHHLAATGDAGEILRSTLSTPAILGVSADSVLGGDEELEGLAGLSALALRLPNTTIHGWHFNPETDKSLVEQPEALREHLGVGDDLRTMIMFADPFSTPMPKLLPAIESCAEGDAVIPVSGGLASGANRPGINTLVINDQVATAGAVGVSIAGGIDIDFLVSQGCRPIGRPLVVTQCNRNVALQLGGDRALDVLQEMANDLTETEKQLLRGGLLCGVVINEYKERFGRGDFLMRNVMGYDQKVGGIAIGEQLRVGQTIQFHVRDAETASEDLQLLLDMQELKAQSFAALLFTCNGRGRKLFGESNHDAGAIQQRLGPIPLSGFFAAGEIGPIGDRSFVHGHTASLMMFRER